MFIWDFNAIFAVVVIVVLTLVFILRVIYTFNRDAYAARTAEWEQFRQCHYCGYVYMDYFKRSPCRCPRCLSYHDQ